MLSLGLGRKKRIIEKFSGEVAGTKASCLAWYDLLMYRKAEGKPSQARPSRRSVCTMVAFGSDLAACASANYRNARGL